MNPMEHNLELKKNLAKEKFEQERNNRVITLAERIFISMYAGFHSVDTEMNSRGRHDMAYESIYAARAFIETVRIELGE